MDVILSDRCVAIFKTIYENETTPIKNLTHCFNLSDRTIRNDIVDINSYLKSSDSTIILQRNIGYSFSNKINAQPVYELFTNQSTAYLSTDSLENRLFLTTTFLLSANDYISMTELCEYVYVGSSTMTTYINTIKKQIKPFNLKITSKSNLGYKIQGSEQDIRSYIFESLVVKNDPNYVSVFSEFELTLFDKVNLPDLYDIVLFFFPPTKYKFNDYYRKNLVIKLAIMINRIIEGHHFDSETTDHISKSAHSIVNSMINEIEELYQITIDNSNIQWLISQIFFELVNQTNTVAYSDNQFELIVFELLEKIRTNFDLDLSTDPILKEDLIKHLASYLPKTENKKNPLLDVIKKKYAYAFEICISSIEQIKLLRRYHLNEDDIGYIAIHIAAGIERQHIGNNSQLKTALICGQGFSTSRLLEATLKRKFAENIKVTKILSYAEFKTEQLNNIDLIISTIPLEHEEIPIINFDFLNLTNSINNIQKVIEKHQKSKNILTSLFSTDSFIVKNEYIKKSEALLLLLNTGNYRDDERKLLIEKIENREKIHPTNISDYIAIPHVIDDSIQQSRIMVLINKEKIIWDKCNKLSTIFLMLVSPNDKNKLQSFMEWISEIIDDDDKQIKISELDCFNHFIEMMTKSY